LAASGAKKKLTKRNAMGVSPVATGDKGYAPLTSPPFKERKQTRKRDLREFASQTVADENFLTKSTIQNCFLRQINPMRFPLFLWQQAAQRKS